MALILLGFRRLAAFWTRVEVNTMRHHNSVFHSLQKHIPWPVFDRLVDKHGTDHRVRRLDSKSQFLAILFGQLSGATSLREIETGLLSHSNQLYHLGARCPARSTLADANASRSWALFGDLFAHMAAHANRQTRRAMADAIHILDATRLRLSGASGSWLRAQKGHWAAKLHVVYDPDGDQVVRADVTPQQVNDITCAQTMPIEPGTTYVFDLAYYDYKWWARLNQQGCRIVSRLKSHTRLERTTQQAVPEGEDILSDCIGYLPAKQSHSRHNPFTDPVREIKVRISTGKLIRIVTNDLEAPATQIAELYKRRWQVELFFKWIKQNLKIRHFLGTSENAVRIQIFVALIAHLLLRIAQATQTQIKQPLAFARLIRLNLMHKRPINALKKPIEPPPKYPGQLILDIDTC